MARIAANIFVEKGYEQAQIDDVVAAMAVGKGTIYRFVSSKHALLQVALLHADAAPPKLPDLPFKAQPKQLLRDSVVQRVAPIIHELRRLQVAPEMLHSPRAMPDLIAHLYGVMERARFAIKVLERNRHVLPEVAAAWQEQRTNMVALLGGFLRRQASVGRVSAVARQPLLSHAVLQSVLYWAVHRHWDASAPETTSADGQLLLYDLLVPALHPASQREHNPPDAANEFPSR